MKHAGGRAQHGFTLLELMAALAILALTMTVLLGAVGDGSRLAGKSVRAGQMALQARSLLEGLGLSGPLQVGNSEGVLDDGKTHWQLHIQPYPGSSAQVQLLHIELILQRDGQQQRFVTLRAQIEGQT